MAAIVAGWASRPQGAAPAPERSAATVRAPRLSEDVQRRGIDRHLQARQAGVRAPQGFDPAVASDPVYFDDPEWAPTCSWMRAGLRQDPGRGAAFLIGPIRPIARCPTRNPRKPVAHRGSCYIRRSLTSVRTGERPASAPSLLPPHADAPEAAITRTPANSIRDGREPSLRRVVRKACRYETTMHGSISGAFVSHDGRPAGVMLCARARFAECC